MKQGEAQQRHLSALQQNLFVADTAHPVQMCSCAIVLKINVSMFAMKIGQGGPGAGSGVRAKGIAARLVSRAPSASPHKLHRRTCAKDPKEQV